VLRGDPQFNPKFATAGVWDITSENLPDGIAEESCDVITLCFVLSALVYTFSPWLTEGTPSMETSSFKSLSSSETWWIDMFP
jgi:hypothetical protein